MKYKTLITTIVTALSLLSLAGSASACEPTINSIGISTVRASATSVIATANDYGYEALSGSTYYLEYGTTTSYGTATPAVSVTSSNSTFSAAQELTGLSPDTTYHVRLRGTFYAEDRISDGMCGIPAGTTHSYTVDSDDFTFSTAIPTTTTTTSTTTTTTTPTTTTPGGPADTAAPNVALSLSRVRLSKVKRILAHLSTNEPASGRAISVVKIRSRSGKRRTIALKTSNVSLSEKSATQVAISLSSSLRKTLLRALRNGKTVKATVKTVVADSVGNTTTVAKTVKITR